MVVSSHTNNLKIKLYCLDRRENFKERNIKRDAGSLAALLCRRLSLKLNCASLTMEIRYIIRLTAGWHTNFLKENTNCISLRGQRNRIIEAFKETEQAEHKLFKIRRKTFLT